MGYKEDLIEFVRLITQVEHLMSGDQLSATLKIIVNYQKILERVEE